MDKHEMRKGYYERMRKFKEKYENDKIQKGIGKPRYRMNKNKSSEISKDKER